MIGRFRVDTNPKQDSDSDPPRQQEAPWMITKQDLERNMAKVWEILTTHIFLSPSSSSLELTLCDLQSLRQIRLNEVLLDYSRDAALIVMWVQHL